MVAAVLRRYSWYLLYGLVFPTVSASLLASHNAKGLILPNILGLLCYLATARWLGAQGVLGLAVAYPAAFLVSLSLSCLELLRARVLTPGAIAWPAARAVGLGAAVAGACVAARAASLHFGFGAAPGLTLGLLAAALATVASLWLLDRQATAMVFQRIDQALRRRRLSEEAPTVAL